jgi:hemolysin activation/secretion protein
MTTELRSFTLLKPLIATLALAGLTTPTCGQSLPDAGSILQQLQPSLPASPSSEAPSLQMQPRDDTALPDSAPFEVKRLHVSGNSVFATEILHTLVASAEGKHLTLAQVNALAGRITAYYRDRGYPLARAIIPAQRIQDGVVVIQVIEARYGQVRLNNQSKVDGGLLQSIISPLHSGDVIDDAGLNRSLLLLSDVPGVSVAATLQPGTDVGTSDVTVNAAYNPVTFANIALDNYGNRYIDRLRLSGNINIVNPLHHGDIFSATMLSTGSGMNFGRLSYDTLVNGQGTRVGGSYSYLRYKLGREIEQLGANGTASVASLWAKHPLLRSKETNIYAQLQFDRKQLRDHVDVTALRTDRHLQNWVLSLNGDLRDNLMAGGVNVWSLGWTSGRVVFDDATAATADAAAGQTRGSFSKWNANFSRLQALTPRSSVYLNFAAQWSNGNLDSAEKMTAGGPYNVRAYDVGSLSGDTGYTSTIELRHELGDTLVGRWQAVAFVDSAYVKVNHSPWTTGKNSGSLSGAGIGLNWAGSNQWRAAVSVATRLGAKQSLVADQSSVRGWITVSKAF